MLGADGAQQLEPVDVGQHDIEHGEVEILLQDRLGGISPVVGERHTVPLVLQVDTYEIRDSSLVVDDEDMRVHPCSFPPSSHYDRLPMRTPFCHGELRGLKREAAVRAVRQIACRRSVALQVAGGTLVHGAPRIRATRRSQARTIGACESTVRAQEARRAAHPLRGGHLRRRRRESERDFTDSSPYAALNV